MAQAPTSPVDPLRGSTSAPWGGEGKLDAIPVCVKSL